MIDKSRTFLLQHRPTGWFIVDSAGVAKVGPYRMRNEAEGIRRKMQVDANRAPIMRERLCLTCGRAFDSEGPHHRMCSPCRHGSEPFTVAGSIAPKGSHRASKL